MKHINRVINAISQLQYRKTTDCIELRLFLLSLLGEFVNQYRRPQDRAKAEEAMQSYRELEGLYKNFTMNTEDPFRNHKAQFEFTKTLILDNVSRFQPSLEIGNAA